MAISDTVRIEKKVAVIGHSFVRYLPLPTMPHKPDSRLSQTVYFRKFHRSGATALNLLDRIEEDISLFQPDLSFVIIGGNDLDRSGPINFREVVDNIKTVLDRERLHTRGEVYCCTIEKRPSPRYVNPIRFNIYKNRVNQIMKKDRSIRLFFSQARDNTTLDGVHLNDVGNEDLVREISNKTADWGLQHGW